MKCFIFYFDENENVISIYIYIFLYMFFCKLVEITIKYILNHDLIDYISNN